MSFTGGKLKLKGGEPLKGSIDKKKRKKKSTTLAVLDPEAAPAEQEVRGCMHLQLWVVSIAEMGLSGAF